MFGEHPGVEDQRPVRIAHRAIGRGYFGVEGKQLTDSATALLVFRDESRLGALDSTSGTLIRENNSTFIMIPDQITQFLQRLRDDSAEIFTVGVFVTIIPLER
jgi:hypothetical protein